MFCPKCGAKSIDGGVFCQKCGAKLIIEDSVKTNNGSVSENQKIPKPMNDSSMNASPKKKSKKLPIILGILILAVVAIVTVGGMWDDQADYETSSETEKKVNLSETYTNEDEGISFRYPSAWVPVSGDELTDRLGNMEDEEYPLILLANENEDLPEENSYIMVSKFDATQDMIDHLFVDDEQFAATFDHDVTVKNTSAIKIDGVAAREITYTEKGGIGYQSYFYAVAPILYRIDFRYKGESAGNKQRFFDAVINSYKITADKTADDGKIYPDSEKASTQTDDDTSDMLLYNGIPIDTIMEMSEEEVIAAFGEPDEYSDENFVQILSEDGERLVAMAYFDSKGQVSYFSGDPKKFELNGQNLDQDYDGLAETFDREPDYQVMYDLLEIKWFYDSYSVLIGLDDDGLPGKAEVRKKNTVEETEQLIYDWMEDGHQMEDGCYPEYVGEGMIDDTGAEVYNFQFIVGEDVWLSAAVEKDTGEMWAVLDDGSIMPLNEYYNEYDNGSDAAASNLPNGFLWVEEPTGKTSDWTTTITGIIKNTSDQTYDYVSISFNLYDSSGNQIGTASAHISNLKSGGTWKFEASSGLDASTFEFSSFNYY